jgi:2'-5' RNA ligase
LDEVARLDAAAGPRDAALRWVPTEQWHLTLTFCGEVNPPVVPELQERLRRAAGRTDPFTVQLAGAGTFPRRAEQARVLWIGVAGDVPALSRLAERCAAAARRCGIEVDDRRYRPHLTLARGRDGGADARARLEALAPYDGRPWRVDRLQLVRSRLGPQVRHETLDEFALSG